MGNRRRPCGTPLFTQAELELVPVLKTSCCLVDQRDEIVRAVLLWSAKIYRTAARLSMQFMFWRFIVIPTPAQSAAHKSLLLLLENQYPFQICQQSWNEHYAYLCIFPLVNPTTYGDDFPIKSNVGYILGPSHVISEPYGACLLHPHEQFTHTLTPILINTIEL